MKYKTTAMLTALGMVLVCTAGALASAESRNTSDQPPQNELTLRAYGVPTKASNVGEIAAFKILAEFRKRNPNVVPVSTTGLQVSGGKTMDMVPLMQIAGDIPAHVMYVNFRQSDTYISNKFLYPLDRYIERDLLGLKDFTGGPNMSLDKYVAKLKESPKYKTLVEPRVPMQAWKVMRRKCPYGKDCPFAHKTEDGWDFEPTENHEHIWAFPERALVTALVYRKDLFQEAGLPDRGPKDLEELLEWARKLTNPRENRYGLQIGLSELGWTTLSFLYSHGGLIVAQDEEGNWKCVFDSEEAVETYYYVARLFLEEYESSYTDKDGKHETLKGVVYTDESKTGNIENAMSFSYISQKFFQDRNPEMYNFAPVPLGPTGKRGSEFNCGMLGIYAGLENNKPLRNAAWEYIKFFDSPDARMIHAKEMIENGLARYVQPELLDATGFPEYKRLIPAGWKETSDEALRNGIPEPYGKNCQMVYTYVSQAISQIRVDEVVQEAIKNGDARAAKNRIREILKERCEMSNQKMLLRLSPEVKTFRTWVAGGVALAIFVIFTLLFRKVFKTFDQAQVRDPNAPKGKWQFGRYKWAYLLLIPAVGSVLLWRYYPLIKGTFMAFQNYNVRGFSEFVGLENFAMVLYDGEFWHSLYISLKFAFFFALFGFCAPIILAFLLTEVPRGTVLFRTIYYLPAVLSGAVVMFLWKQFYGPYGMINEVVNGFVYVLNLIPGVALSELRTNWLDDKNMALFCLLLPMIWVGMGPGCLIYLAALKTIPEEIYEAADIDGAGIISKAFNVAIPGIKSLIMINFIGVMVGMIKGMGSMVLAMTSGGPYTPYGQTEVVGLRIFYEAFGFLRFGTAVAMGWVLGSMLVGFTVIQLQRLSKMEFRTAKGSE